MPPKSAYSPEAHLNLCSPSRALPLEGPPKSPKRHLPVPSSLEARSLRVSVEPWTRQVSLDSRGSPHFAPPVPRQGPEATPALGGAPGPRDVSCSQPLFGRLLRPPAQSGPSLQELPGGEPPGEWGPDGGGRAGPLLPGPERGPVRGHMEHAGPEGEQVPAPHGTGRGSFQVLPRGAQRSLLAVRASLAPLSTASHGTSAAVCRDAVRSRAV